MRQEWIGLMLLIRDASIWVLPLLLPTALTLFAFSDNQHIEPSCTALVALRQDDSEQLINATGQAHTTAHPVPQCHAKSKDQRVPLVKWTPYQTHRASDSELCPWWQEQSTAGLFRSLTLSQKRTISGYVFIMPFILGFIFWFLIPALVAVYLTFQKWNLISSPQYVGFENIQRLFEDPLLPKSLWATFLYTVISVPLGLLLSFLLANLINAHIRGIAVFRTIYYLPTIVPAVANAILWAWMFNTGFGLINVFIRSFGGTKVAWLKNPQITIFAYVLLSLWESGGSMIIFLAGLQGIPDIYYEAAEIDGAGRWYKLRHITLPLMSPIFFFNFVIGIINAFQVFTIGFLLTNGGHRTQPFSWYCMSTGPLSRIRTRGMRQHFLGCCSLS